MPKQKYLYALIDPGTKKVMFLYGHPMIYTNKASIQPFFRKFEIAPIPADSLHKLILSHAKKKK